MENATLIREMLAALEAIADDLESGYIAQDSARAERNRNRLLATARAAIRKARGDAS